MLPEFDLIGRKALITGAGRGIGKGIALVLAEAGCDVGVTSLGEENAARVAKEVGALGRRGFGWAADGTRIEPMKAVAEKALGEMGGLDILVNCIGDAIPGSIAPLTWNPWRATSPSAWSPGRAPSSRTSRSYPPRTF